MDLKLGSIKRCGIFLFFDPAGKVDRYVTSMLKDLNKNLDHLLVVCNGYVEPKGIHDLQQVSSEVISRANVGFDVGGYREGLFYMGWKFLGQFDEILMLNYTIFGPIYPFKEMFDTMAGKNISFWGISKHHKVDPDPFHKVSYGYLPEHIQSHFLVLRRDLFMSYQYRDFICNMKNPENYVESVCGYEAIFTKYFEDLGFQWEVYVESSEYEGYAYNPLMFYPKEVVEKKRCPIVKRRSFFTTYSDFLLNTCGEPSAELYKYLREELHYDMDPIWDNLLRLENHAAIHRCLHLNYMLESYDSEYPWDKKAVVILVIESTRRLSWYQRFLREIPVKLDVILCGTKENCEKVHNMEALIGKTVREYVYETEGYLQMILKTSIQIQRKRYQYVGILHMTEIESTEQPYSNEVSWQYSDWENLLHNGHTVENLLQTFEENPRMGMCIPPLPEFGRVFAKIGDGWGRIYGQVCEKLHERGVFVSTNSGEYPLAPWGGSFWMKGELFGNLRDYLREEDEKEFMLMLPFLVQQMGYYTGICYSDSWAPVAVTNQDYMMRENNKAVFQKYGANVLPVVVKRIRDGDFENGE